MYCRYCGSHNHTIKNCPKTHSGSINRLHMKCAYCGSKEHNIDACPKTFHGNAMRAWHPDKISNNFIKDL
ncbi:unnamed protein product [marine sediment metagenome]|uniref:CCHC-type domain-containing protein n=1 Tax=marine sediment metagenome TaxID=412755 RepID=X1FQ47_9ZZZZ